MSLCAEALPMMICVLIMVRFVPFRTYAEWLKNWNANGQAPLLLVDRLRRLIAILEKLLPLRSRCLVSAIVAKAMLARRGYISSLTMGIADNGEALSAHAWLMAGKIVVTGRSAIGDHTELVTF